MEILWALSPIKISFRLSSPALQANFSSLLTTSAMACGLTLILCLHSCPSGFLKWKSKRIIPCLKSFNHFPKLISGGQKPTTLVVCPTLRPLLFLFCLTAWQDPEDCPPGSQNRVLFIIRFLENYLAGPARKKRPEEVPLIFTVCLWLLAKVDMRSWVWRTCPHFLVKGIISPFSYSVLP